MSEETAGTVHAIFTTIKITCYLTAAVIFAWAVIELRDLTNDPLVIVGTSTFILAQAINVVDQTIYLINEVKAERAQATVIPLIADADDHYLNAA